MSDFDLIEYLRKEEEHFLPEPPEELWNGIVDNLPTKSQHRIVPLWLRYCGAAACIALLMGIGSLFFNTPIPNDQLPQIAKRSIGKSIDTPKPQVTTPGVITTTQAIRLADTGKSPLQVVANDDTITHDEEPIQGEQVLPSNGKEERKNGKDEKKTDNKRKRGGYNDLWIADRMVTKSKSRKSASVSLYAGNIMANNTSTQDNFTLIGSGPGEPSDGTTPYDDIFELNQGMDAETKKHYKLPVRTGIRVSVPLTEALAVESGITYTLLSSSMESGSKENYYHTEQTLHYVGIPLKLRYKLWNSKRIGIYVSGGGMVEKCVSGKAKTKFVIGGSKNSIEEQKVSEKPLQLSATLSAGIEANIAKNTCLFIEPGASYYIDNHSSVDNVYKDKPFNLDLNIGIRININK